MPDFVSRLIDITRSTLGIEDKPVTAATDFVEDLGADSLDCVDLMMAVEDAFGVEFEDDELPALTTIGAVATSLRSRAAFAALLRQTADTDFSGTRPAAEAPDGASTFIQPAIASGRPNWSVAITGVRRG